jgi:cytochrome P450
MISALVAAEIEGADGGPRRLDDLELVLFCLLLGVAGNETTSKLIATGVVTLAAFPDERRRLVADPGRWPAAIEELLRFDPPSHYQGRVAMRDLPWHGQLVPQGSIVLLVNGAANRDRREFERPERFVCDRGIVRHLAFGHGTHFCLGAALARLETRVVLEELLACAPCYAVDDDRVERFHSSNVRGLAKVPISASGG